MKRGGSVSEWRDRMKYTRNDFKNQNSQSKKSFYVAACAVLACAAVLGTAYFQTQKTGNTGNSKLAEQPGGNSGPGRQRSTKSGKRMHRTSPGMTASRQAPR